MKIGWIGTGVMGVPMCSHILNKSHDVYVFNRTQKNAMSLVRSGAKWCDSPKEVARCSKVIFLMVGTPLDVQKVILGSSGVIEGISAGSTIVDTTTSSPELAKYIYKKALKRGVFALDAPVSGGDIGAKKGTLAIMVGGDESIYKKTLPLLKVFGKDVVYMGSPGAGQNTKISNQILVAGTMIGVVESLLYAQRIGMDLNKVIDIIGKGAARSWAINILGKKIASKDFESGFFIKHFVKDMGIALAEAERVCICLPGLSLVRQFYISAMAMGYGKLGTQGLYKVLEKMNNLK